MYLVYTKLQQTFDCLIKDLRNEKCAIYSTQILNMFCIKINRI